jgi:hypothetical protein
VKPTSSPWKRGRIVHRAVPDGRKFILEEWKVTQHRGSFLPTAHLLRVKPTFTRPQRRSVPLDQGLQDSPFSATKGGALWKAIVDIEGRIERIEGYRAEDSEKGTDLWKEYTEEITELRHAVTAMRKERAK